jgi:hypothetical protein
MQMCSADGTGYGPCLGEVVPRAEACDTPEDEDCDGQVNESSAGCVCVPGSTTSCYGGPAGTQGVGTCRGGTSTCNATGTGYGPCLGEVTPTTEACFTASDEDCDGQVNEGCVVRYADVQPIFQAKCAPCHTTLGRGGTNFATSYAQSQLPSYSCTGSTKGACTIVRIHNGTMPPGGACTGNPTIDSSRSACLNAVQQQVLADWITGGQLP